MKKLLLSMLMILMTLSLVACKAEEPVAEVKDVTLKVWGAQEDQEMLTGMIEEFKAANPGTNWTIELGVVGEPDARTKYLEDPEAAADVFAPKSNAIVSLFPIPAEA